MSHRPSRLLFACLSLVAVSARAEFSAVCKVVTGSGAAAYEVRTWGSPQAFVANTGGVILGTRPQTVAMESFTVSPNGDLYSVQVAGWDPSKYEIYRYRDAYDFVNNNNTIIGVNSTAGVLAGVTFDASGQFYAVQDVTVGGGSRSYLVKRWASITDFVYDTNPTTLGTRTNSGVQTGIEFIDGRLCSIEEKTGGGVLSYEVWDWGTSFAGFISKTGTKTGTRTGIEQTVAIFSMSHDVPQPQTVVARSPQWPWLGNRFPASIPGSQAGWATTNAFPNLTFEDPVKMLPQPNSNRLWVIGRQGHIWWFENNPATTDKTLALDHYNSTMGHEDCGMLGIAFHPQFGQAGSPNRGYIYVWYNYRPTGNTGSVGANYNRLSRFTLADGASIIDPASEYVLINQFDEHSWHNGGDMFFGPDGFLYVSNGDEGGANDQYNNTQKINDGLFSGVLRIDVDRDASRSHPVRRQPRAGGTPPAGWPGTYTQGYYIPNDNPWLDPGGSVLEEFYAIGLRSPHRMTRDPLTGTVFIGDIGQAAREEVDILARGANFQWGYREGDISGPKAMPSPLIGTDTPPVWSYSRSQGDSCVIGGHVYRGTSLAADIGGKFVFGDYISGRIWAMAWQGAPAAHVTQLTIVTGYTLSGFGVDQGNELYLMSLGAQGKILKLVHAQTQQPPATLSATGAFSDLATLTPAPGVIAFDVNSPLYSDNALKQRWIAVPNNGAPYDSTETVGFNSAAEWTYPAGTVLIKQFDLAVDDTNPDIRRRIETRFNVKTTSGEWYGVAYKWRADGSDADLLEDSATENVTIATQGGGTRMQSWYFPSRSDCMSCHTPASSQVLGPRTWQLNGTYSYPGTTTTGNQLQIWSDIGMFDQTLTPAQIAGFLKTVSIHDTTAPLETRVRSYLDSNCSSCHRPGGVRARMDFRFTTPLSQQSIVNGPLNDTLGINGAYEVAPGSIWQSMMHIRIGSLDPSIQMPPIGRGTVDSSALAVIDAWINGLAPLAAPYPLSAVVTDYRAIALSWTSQSANHTGFVIQRSQNGGTSWSQIATPGAGAASFTDITVVPGTAYQYRIAAKNSTDTSPWSNTVPVTTWPTPGSWDDWQRLHPLGGQNLPLQNPDGDTSANLLEYALGTNPSGGGSGQERFYLTGNMSGGLDAVAIRPSNVIGVTWTFCIASSLGKPMPWIAWTQSPVITNNSDGTQTLTFPNIDTIPALAAARQGFVRLEVTLNATGESAHSATWLWDAHTFATGTRSFGPAMLKPERFSGIVNGGGTILNLVTSAGGTSVRGRFDPARAAYIEITSGTYAGQRFDIDIAASTTTTLALDPASPRNTTAPVPDLTGATVIARDHWTLGDMFPPAHWQAASSATRSDRVMFYSPAAGWTYYWLALVGGTPRWVRQADATLTDQSPLIIPPGAGLFVRKIGATAEILLTGVLRENAFVLPSPAGITLIASGWPADQSPASRAMLLSDGFTGANASSNADQFMRWAPDLNPASAEGFLSHYLLKTATLQYWTPMGNATLPNENNTLLFPRHQAAFIKLKNAQPNWTLPSPWQP
ncbi:MAG: PQQ-dependent sugar dehydrogenase [Verrucomicrobiaceae bacterium]|nr:PQQ-dependent sugar dehydrogenase [Verrucomicrobiaceae bacterium]